jgi:hypothetical protein
MASRSTPWPTALERFRSWVRTSAVVLGAVLVAFHGWLFATQVASGRLEDPWLVFRWMVAAGLVAGLVAIRRGGASMWSRQGTAIWVLAALLHGPAVATDFSLESLALPETAATAVLQMASTTLLAVSLWMLAGLLARRDRHARLYSGRVAASSLAGIFDDGYSPQYFSRPPPRPI